MIHHGSCHCGRISLSFSETPTEAIQCNCSLCRRRGALLAGIPGEAFQLHTPRSDLSTYTFPPHRFRHHFCPGCGCAPFAEAPELDGETMVVINLNCTDVDLAQVRMIPFDGTSL